MYSGSTEWDTFSKLEKSESSKMGKNDYAEEEEGYLL